jgi:signal transduction histidine kinase
MLPRVLTVLVMGCEPHCVSVTAAVGTARPPGRRAFTAWSRIPVVYVAAGFGVPLGTAGLAFKVGLGSHSLTDTVLIGASGFLFVIAGVLAHARQPETRIGLLMVLVGCGLFAEDLQLSRTAWVHTAGMLLIAASSGFVVHLVLAFPSGRLKGLLERWLVGTTYVAVFVLIPFGQLFYDTRGKPVSRTNLLLISTDVPVISVVNQAVEIIGTVVALGVVSVLVRRWARASPPMRRVLAPVFLAGLVGGVATAVGEAFSLDHHLYAVLIWVYRVAFCLLPLAFLAGILRIQLGQTPVETLLKRLRGPLSAAQLRAALAQALGDPSLEVGYWRADVEAFVDGDGRPLKLPETGSGRGIRLVEHDGRRVAALVHDSALLDNVPLLDAVAAAAGLALENQRLGAEFRAQLAEGRASRSRIVAAADAERRRLERDLHDGAQQRLVSAVLSLRLIQQHLGAAADAGTTNLLAKSAEELQAAIGELREFARGIHPAILTDAGLMPALRVLARRTPLDIRLAAADVPRLNSTVEATGYFVVAEALTNVLKHARARLVRITVSHREGLLHIDVTDDGVGGADISAGSGLRGLCDRVSALDGTLTVHSVPGRGTSVSAVIPSGAAGNGSAMADG